MSISVLLALGACTTVPGEREATGGIPTREIVLRTKCELSDAFRTEDGRGWVTDTPQYAWLEDWTAQVDLTLQVLDDASFSPGATLTEPLRNGYAVAAGPTTLGGTAIGAVAQNFSFAAAGSIDGQAARIQSMTYVFSLHELKRWRERTDTAAACVVSDSSDLRGRLGLREWIVDALNSTTYDDGEELLYAGFHPNPSGGSTAKGGSTKPIPAKGGGGGGGGASPASGELTLPCDAAGAAKKAALATRLKQARNNAGRALKELGSLRGTIDDLKSGSTPLLRSEKANAKAVADFDVKARPYRRVLEPDIASGKAQADALAKVAALNAKTTSAAVNDVEAAQQAIQAAMGVFPSQSEAAAAAVDRIDPSCASTKTIDDANMLVDQATATATTLSVSASNVRTAREDVAVLRGQEAALGKFAKGLRPIDPPIASIGQSVNFVLSLGAGASPTWTFVRFKGPNNPLFSTSSTRTHILNISVGPTAEGSLRAPGVAVATSQMNLLYTTLLPLRGSR